MRPILLATSLALLAVPAHAGETRWQEVAPGVSMRLISTGQIKPDGTTLVGIEIDMPETTKTYWRVPGDTGLPTELDLAGSSGVAGHEIHWPYPTRHETAAYLDYVYFGPTVLPLVLRVNAADAQLELSATLGICSDICIPAQAQFSLPLADANPDRPNGLRLRQALALAPMPWQDDKQPVWNCRPTPAWWRSMSMARCSIRFR
jgi:DsbC/DsbD-like thiol-disulfide interchange protein